MGDNRNPILPHEKERIIKYLNERVKPCSETGCHVWQKNVKSEHHPYGNVHLFNRSIKAHRLAAFVYLGLLLEDAKTEVCHACDNPRCINPAHLFLADHTGNMKDASQKKRMKRLNGSKNPSCKLTQNQVDYIKKYRNTEKTYKQIAEDFHVNEMTVYRIVYGHSWKE